MWNGVNNTFKDLEWNPSKMKATEMVWKTKAHSSKEECALMFIVK